MTLGMAFGTIAVLAGIVLICIYMVRETGKQAPTFFAGFYLGAVTLYLLSWEDQGGLGLPPKGKVPLLGDKALAAVSFLDFRAWNPDWATPDRVNAGFLVILGISLFTLVTFLLHWKPSFSFGSKKGGGQGRNQNPGNR